MTEKEVKPKKHNMCTLKNFEIYLTFLLRFSVCVKVGAKACEQLV